MNLNNHDYEIGFTNGILWGNLRCSKPVENPEIDNTLFWKIGHVLNRGSGFPTAFNRYFRIFSDREIFIKYTKHLNEITTR